jgi:hypothetical protein
MKYKPGDIVRFSTEAENHVGIKGTAIIDSYKGADRYFLKEFPTAHHSDWFTLVIPKEGIKHDSGKLRYSLLPWNALKEVAKVLEFGTVKYSVNNWQKIEPQRYEDAAMRHLVAILEGEWIDEESNLPHAAHCICCLLFLIWFKLNE